MAMSDSEREMPFLEHLEELRWRIFKALIAFVLGMIICFIFAKQLLNVLTYPTTLLNPPLNLQVLKVQGMFIVYIEIGFFGGVIFALPVILYQFWSFISPGLKPDERRYFIPLLGSATLLFLLGVSFAYFGIMPYALRFFIGLAPTEIDPNIAIDFYIGFIIRLMLLFGLVFEMPVISYFLGKIGLIDTALMKKYRRHAIVGVFIVAALLTPPDPVTQIFLGIPLVLLYEFSIFIVYMVQKKEKEKEEEAEARLDGSTEEGSEG